MKNLNMARKLGLGFGSMTLLVCLLGYMAYGSLGNSAESIMKITNAYIPAAGTASSILDDLRVARYYMLQYESFARKADYTEAEKFISLMDKEFEKMQQISAAFPDLKVLASVVRDYPPLYKNYKESSQATDRSITTATELVKAMLTSASVMEKSLAQVEQLIYEGQKEFYALGDANALLRNGNSLYMATQAAQMFKEIRRLYANARQTYDVAVKKQIDDISENIARILKDLESNLMRQPSKDSARGASAAMKEYITNLDILLQSWQDVQNASKSRLESSTRLVAMLVNLHEAANDNATKFAQNANILSASAIKSIIGVSCGAVLLSIILAILITRLVTLPLGRSMLFAQSVAAGHLDDVLDVESKDEIGKLADALRTMVASLKTKIGEANDQAEEARKMGIEARSAMEEAKKAQAEAESAKREGMLAAARQLEGIVEVVSSASTQLAAQVEESEHGAAITSERIAETATAMEEMNAAVLEVARSAGGASQIAGDAKEKAEHGAGIVENVVRCIADVEQQSTQLKSDMAQLGQQAEAIGTIMNVISDIADQTNLLALNAAIEAARAGEAGRGFAVVADEVRKLAEKTMQATVEVDTAIKGVQKSAEKNMSNVDSSGQIIAQATTLARQAGVSLEEIVSLVDTSAAQVSTIATAAEEQSSTSEEINHSLGEVSNASSETARAMAEAAQAVSDLSQQAHKMAQLINEMKRG